MKFINKNIQQFLLNRELNSSKKNKREFIAWDKAKSIAIVYDATQKENRELVHNWAQKLRNTGKEINELGFINEKKLSNMLDVRYGNEYFSRAELSFFGIPEKSRFNDFLNRKFDYLICLNSDSNILLLYFALKSNTKSRIGFHSDHQKDFFDIMIKPQKNDSIAENLVLIENYLKIL